MAVVSPKKEPISPIASIGVRVIDYSGVTQAESAGVQIGPDRHDKAGDEITAEIGRPPKSRRKGQRPTQINPVER
jgi:hypothetical protein